jgi:molybdopterin synthase sulfur carrier subunit
VVKIVYFARIREALGIPEETVHLPAGVTDVAGFVDWLAGRSGTYADQLARPFRVAVNQEMATPDAPLRDGDEVAVFPPVTGG